MLLHEHIYNYQQYSILDHLSSPNTPFPQTLQFHYNESYRKINIENRQKDQAKLEKSPTTKISIQNDHPNAITKSHQNPQPLLNPQHPHYSLSRLLKFHLPRHNPPKAPQHNDHLPGFPRIPALLDPLTTIILHLLHPAPTILLPIPIHILGFRDRGERRLLGC